MTSRLESGLMIVPSCTSKTRRRVENSSDYDNKENFMVALPRDIPELILCKLDVVGFQCFSAVCRSWRLMSIALKKRLPLYMQPSVPWLMFSSSPDHDPSFFSLSNGRILRPILPEARGLRCCGSSWGWLIMVGGRGKFLLNPLTRIRIALPDWVIDPKAPEKLEKLDLLPFRRFIHKALLLSPPTVARATTPCFNLGAIVVLIDVDRCVYFCRLGDEGWTFITSGRFEDIIFYNGQVYAISSSFELGTLDLGPDPRFMSCGTAPPEGEPFRLFDTEAVYLVECLGELLMVIRRWNLVCPHPDGFCKCHSSDDHLPKTNVLKIFKLDPKGKRWTPVENLVHQMLFVGSSGGISLSALNYPSFEGNCIYFTQQDFHPLELEDVQTVTHVCNDTGVFHLEDKSFKPLFFADGVSPTSPPVWFTPISW